ncbi:uncharacterized protein C8Q71DRAFT_167947 [Rhodofomes roseus]|uniref:Autophagy-related protein 29 n=2 Tax=Rhodofomes roseus TaxID=34475 RepID=A0ABQ8K8N4_9APHY|nr:uncharacterized protein C8Q71DRAFT_167947 [Rhodofomes roseus]KAH9833635.1 hypothetical protein C8Q71DRAFT_167947 [Rhodofomes roseus]
MATNQPVRVIVRLPYNRPEDPPPDPPRVEWTPEKEHMLWEVVDKSSATKGATTDWEGLAAHLEVPIPYLIHRTRTRFEEGLRGLQGIRTVSTPTVPFSPAAQQPPQGNEYFPRLPEVASRRLSTSGNASRPLGVRARLSSLGSLRARRGSLNRVTSQRLSLVGQATTNGNGNGNALASGSGGVQVRASKKVSSSSTLTLQGPRRSRGSPHRPLSPTSSHAALEAEADEMGDDEGSDGSDEDEAAKREEEDEREAEAKELERKLEKLQLMMTTDALGLVSSPAAPRDRDKGKQVADRGRTRPLSSSMASLSSAPHRASRSQQSLSSLSSRGSPHGSIPSIPSSPPRAETHARRYSYADARVPYSQRHEESLSPTSSSPRVASPIPRHLSPPGQSHSPPAISPNRAVGQTYVGRTPPRTSGGLGWRMDVGAPVNGGRVSSQGSEASSFSDLSDASLSASALESALASNIRGNGSRLSSFARSHLTGKRGVR